MRLVKTGADGERQCADVLKINRPDDLGDIANLGLTLAKGSCCWPAFNRRSSRRRPRATRSGGNVPYVHGLLRFAKKKRLSVALNFHGFLSPDPMRFSPSVAG